MNNFNNILNNYSALTQVKRPSEDASDADLFAGNKAKAQSRFFSENEPIIFNAVMFTILRCLFSGG